VAEERRPRFSVVVPAYNAAGTLSETLDGVLAQELPDWECVVVDDGSTDGTLEIALTYERRDERFRAIRQENAGTAGAYNTGVESAKGEFVVMCSADDLLLPRHLASIGAFIDREPDYDIYSANGYYLRPDGSRDLVNLDKRGRGVHSLRLADVIRVCFYSVGAAYRRDVFTRIGGYRVGIFGEDYDFWLRAMAAGARHRYLPEPLSLFRISTQQKSSQVEAMYRSDIELVSELARSAALSPEEHQAVADNIRERERLIALLHHPAGRLRPKLKGVAISLLGAERARRYWRAVRALPRRPGTS
jgi:glycosyltransferase involved in cell wall biosynthesis